MIGLPQIEINFKQLAASIISRSAKGTVAIVVKDATDSTFNFVEYKLVTDIQEAKFTPENVKLIKDAFLGNPSKVIVVRIATADTFSKAATILDGLKYNWLCFVEATAAEQTSVATYVKGKNTTNKTRKIKATVFNATTTDDIHIVNFVNTKVKRVGETVEIDGYKYLPRLAGLLAGLPFTRSATFYYLTDLSSVIEPADVEASINGGKFVIINDFGEVKIARGVNSLTTLSGFVTEDMKKITIVEAMDQIIEDIATEFKNNYVGKYKNKYDNQALFISAINGYFRDLAKDEVLDEEYNNQSGVDIIAQREAWLSSGKAEAANWDEFTVKKNTFRSNIYLAGNVKILDAIEDLKFNVSMA